MTTAASLNRAGLYGAFAALFLEPPTAADIDGWREAERIVPLSPLYDDPDVSPLTEEAALLTRVWRDAVDAESAASTLNRAFCRLFLGVGGVDQAALPYESAYEGDTPRLFGEASGTMQVLLEQRGLAVAGDCREPPDHLSLELAFMERLADGAAEEAAAADEAVRFLDTHLLAWMPTFTDRCQACDDSGFYAGLSRLLHAFLRKERDAWSRRLEADAPQAHAKKT